MEARVNTVAVVATPDGRLSRRQAARYVGVAERTLANWKSTGRGPRQVKVGGRVFYKLPDLDAFIQRTSEHR
jgi:predicted DNA-binding transcriptional regulator AlpA